MDAGGSSGPFKVARYSHTTGFDLVPNPLYYGAKPVLQHYLFPFYQDEESIFKAYQAGQVDYTSVPPAELATARTEPGFGDVPQLTILFMTMNYQSRPFDNIKIRQAFALAIDKDLLVKTVLRNAFLPTNHLVPQGMPGYNQTLTGPDGTTSTAGNASLAVHLLHEGMVEEGITMLPPITFTLTSAFLDVASAMGEMWKQVLGVVVQLQELAPAVMWGQEQATQNHTGPLQMWIGGWQADYPDPQDWLSIFFAKGADNNQCNYGQNSTTVAVAQQQVQKDLLQADSEQDATKRLHMYAVAEQKIVNDVGWVPLWQVTLQELLRPKVQQLVINAENLIPPEDWGNIYIA
jgi:peptide/nickel transport system substrate-binding protein/oligopeptide transport system substrate-binding protein